MSCSKGRSGAIANIKMLDVVLAGYDSMPLVQLAIRVFSINRDMAPSIDGSTLNSIASYHVVWNIRSTASHCDSSQSDIGSILEVETKAGVWGALDIWWPNSAILAVWQFHSWVFEFRQFHSWVFEFRQFNSWVFEFRQFHSWVFECSAVSLLGFTPGCLSVWQFHSWVFECSAVSLLGVRVFGSFTPGCLSVRHFHSWVFECLAVSLLGVQVFGSLSEETR